MIGITIGDPCGIGPEVIIKSLNSLPRTLLKNLLLIGSKKVFELYSKLLRFDLKFCSYEIASDCVFVEDVGVEIESLNLCEEECARVALLSIDKSIQLLKEGKISGVVNGPVSKERISKILPGFRGHTDYYAKSFGTNNYNMAFYSSDLRIVLLTDHIPLKEVFNYLSYDNLKRTILNANDWIKKLDNIAFPKLGICGINPHSGEGGNIGNEEEIIRKVLEDINLNVIGPISPDTAFLEYKKRNLDCLIALYHDQGLIGFKLLHFRDGVNTTIGLPFVRCSPDHGTAFDIAGKGLADNKSMLEAIKYALRVESEVK